MYMYACIQQLQMMPEFHLDANSDVEMGHLGMTYDGFYEQLKYLYEMYPQLEENYGACSDLAANITLIYCGIDCKDGRKDAK